MLTKIRFLLKKPLQVKRLRRGLMTLIMS